jgi:hypothetical protein
MCVATCMAVHVMFGAKVLAPARAPHLSLQVVPCAALATFAHPFTSHLLIFRVRTGTPCRHGSALVRAGCFKP